MMSLITQANYCETVLSNTCPYFDCYFQVVYAIMHRQEVFLPFKNHPRFNELLENIYNVSIQKGVFSLT